MLAKKILRKCNYISVVSLLVMALSSCVIENNDDSSAMTYRGVDDFLKVAVNYIGEANCETGHKADRSHHLDGPNGELMLEQATHLDRRSYGFSGDALMGRTSKESVTRMEDIEAMCRRLILSVDVDEGSYPTVELTKGFALQNKKAKFEKDFGNNDYGEIDCMGDTTKALCTFANIQGKNGKKRWFTYLEPDSRSRSVEGDVIIVKDDDRSKDSRYPITLNGIYREDLGTGEFTHELKEYLDDKCVDPAKLSRRDTNERKAFGRHYPGHVYAYLEHNCNSLLLGLEDPAVVAYLRECGASCVYGYDGNKFALKFERHDLYTDCRNEEGTHTRTENIGFHIADGKLHWFETEGDNAKKSWYDCKTGKSSENAIRKKQI